MAWIMSIAFVDIEASALENGFPIEIGWACIDGKVGAALVRRHLDWRGLEWSVEAERIHRISFDRLEAGVSRQEALARVCTELAGYQCFSDAPDYDWGWLAMLSPGQQLPLKLGKTPADSVLIAIAEQAGVASPIAARIVERAKRTGNHTAAGDAAGLAAAYEVLNRGGEIRMRDVEAALRRWQALSAVAAPWRNR